MSSILSEYNHLIWQSRAVSQLGIVLLSIVAFAELIRTIYLWFYGPPIADEIYYTWLRILILKLLIVAALCFRFIIFSVRGAKGSVYIGVSWWVVLISLFIYFAQSQALTLTNILFGANSFSDSLLRLWFLFLVASIIRFLITVFFAVWYSKKSVAV